MKISKYIPHLAILSLIFIFMGCSGGTGGSASSINSVPPPTVNTARPSITLSNYSLHSNELVTVSVRFVDSEGKRASRVPVLFETTPGIGAFTSPVMVITDLNGNASISYMAANTTGVGTITATATINGAPVSQYATFFVNLPPLQLSPIMLEKSTITAGSAMVVSVDIRDSFGNPYKLQDVDVFFSAEFGYFMESPMTIAANGTRVRSVNGKASTIYYNTTSTNSLGSYVDTITATIADTTVTAHVTVTRQAAAKISYFGNYTTGSIPLTKGSSVTLRYVVTDMSDLGLPNQVVAFGFSPHDIKYTKLSAITAITDSNGFASVVLSAPQFAADENDPRPFFVRAALDGLGYLFADSNKYTVVPPVKQ